MGPQPNLDEPDDLPAGSNGASLFCNKDDQGKGAPGPPRQDAGDVGAVFIRRGIGPQLATQGHDGLLVVTGCETDVHQLESMSSPADLWIRGLSAMTNAHQALYDRIRSYAFDDGDEVLPFVKRLARENDWTLSYARRAIHEYRRFMFLAATAGPGVTPSDQVDQVWHLHLTYTRAYWDRFCCDIVGAPIHHGPTRGGATEKAKFANWYVKTLESYRRVFGEAPPPDIWPEVSIRFGDDLHFERVNTRRHWVVKKPTPPRAAWIATAAATVILTALVLPDTGSTTPTNRFPGFTGRFEIIRDSSPPRHRGSRHCHRRDSDFHHATLPVQPVWSLLEVPPKRLQRPGGTPVTPAMGVRTLWPHRVERQD